MNLFEIEGRIIAGDILTEPFCCDLAECRGACCVEGNSGAPLDGDECVVLEREYPNFQQFMTSEGKAAVERQGYFVVDEDGEPTTTLVAPEAECAYSYNADGITLCAIERAFNEGLTDFQKPISCHLYPIRVKRFSDGSIGLNYHRWDVCGCAVECGKRNNMPLYKALKEPLVRRFGEAFYGELEEIAKAINNE